MIGDITKVPILLHTMDSYDWCWNNWYTLFKKYVHNHGPIYFLTEDKAPDFVDDVIHIKSGKGEWGERLLKGLGQIDSDLIFYMQEDFWATKDMILTNNLLDLFYHLDMETMIISYLVDSISLEKVQNNLYKYTQNSNYTQSHGFGLWRKDVLCNNILPNENPWQNEINGTLRRNKSEHNVYIMEFDWYKPSVRRGKLMDRGKQILIDNGLLNEK
jgi:hypothetical protein